MRGQAVVCASSTRHAHVLENELLKDTVSFLSSLSVGAWPTMEAMVLMTDSRTARVISAGSQSTRAPPCRRKSSHRGCGRYSNRARSDDRRGRVVECGLVLGCARAQHSTFQALRVVDRGIVLSSQLAYVPHAFIERARARGAGGKTLLSKSPGANRPYKAITVKVEFGGTAARFFEHRFCNSAGEKGGHCFGCLWLCLL